jgi:hypothetical protein
MLWNQVMNTTKILSESSSEHSQSISRSNYEVSLKVIWSQTLKTLRGWFIRLWTWRSWNLLEGIIYWRIIKKGLWQIKWLRNNNNNNNNKGSRNTRKGGLIEFLMILHFFQIQKLYKIIIYLNMDKDNIIR